MEDSYRNYSDDPQDKVDFFAWMLRHEVETVVLVEGGKVYTANGSELYKKYLDWMGK